MNLHNWKLKYWIHPTFIHIILSLTWKTSEKDFYVVVHNVGMYVFCPVQIEDFYDFFFFYWPFVMGQMLAWVKNAEKQRFLLE
jgi:hypothetical protein